MLRQKLDTNAAALPDSLSQSILQRLDLKAWKPGSLLSIVCGVCRIQS